MKKFFAMMLVLVLCASIAPSAFAAEGFNNSIVGGQPFNTPTQITPQNPVGYDLIRATGDDKEIVMPNRNSYLPTPEYMYADALQNHSVYVYKKLDGSKDEIMPFAYEGEKVTAVAVQEDKTCIVYYDENYKLHAGWVYSGVLSYDHPGIQVTIGYPCVSYVYQLQDPYLSWSRERFSGVGQKFVMLSEKIEDCVQFKLDYQVIAKGGAENKDVLGPRTIYVNDGVQGWVAVGTFNYDEIHAYQVTVNLTEPMDIIAVAIDASCNAANRLSFRQNIVDVMVAA